MTSSHTESFTKLLGQASTTGIAPRGWEASLAERTRDLLTSHDSDLKASATAVLKVIQEHMAALSADARTELLNVETSRSFAVIQAYRLGQIGFAHLVLSQAASKRVDQDFTKTLTSRTHRQCIEAMFYEDKSTSDLARLTNKSMEQTSRNLGFLRKQGISDFRRDSTHIFNFLTPAARHAFAEMLTAERLNLSQEQAPSLTEETHAALAKVMKKLPAALQSAPTFVVDTAFHQAVIE